MIKKIINKIKLFFLNIVTFEEYTYIPKNKHDIKSDYDALKSDWDKIEYDFRKLIR